MYLVVGLGNPGSKYAGTRHNIGFMALDRLADQHAFPSWRSKFGGELSKDEIGEDSVVLLKPQTYMNLSGESVIRAMQFYKIPLERTLIVHDELDLAYEDVRIKVGGGLAGHNGLKSVAQHCGGKDFPRIRIGISRPRGGPVDRYVLSPFNSDERIVLDDVIDKTRKIIETVIKLGPGPAMNRLHGKR